MSNFVKMISKFIYKNHKSHSNTNSGVHLDSGLICQRRVFDQNTKSIVQQKIKRKTTHSIVTGISLYIPSSLKNNPKTTVLKGVSAKKWSKMVKNDDQRIKNDVKI